MFPISLKRAQATEKIIPKATVYTKEAENLLTVEGGVAQTGGHGVGCLEHPHCELTEPPRTNSRREFTSAVVSHRFLHRNFVGV